MNPLQPANSGGGDAFVAKLDVRTPTATTLSSSLNPSAYGQSVTYTATVTSKLGAPPDGESVIFKNNSVGLGSGMLGRGSASLTTATPTVGTHPITAIYGGDSNLLNSKSKALTQVVTKAEVTMTLSASQNPSTVGQLVTFTASVTPQFGGTANGKVTFYDGATALKAIWLSGGTAKFITSQMAAGAHNITATYNGSGNFNGSSASLTQTVR